MVDHLGELARTHTCGGPRVSDVGADVVLLGWVHRTRDLGSLLFFDIRDRHGITQVVARDDEQVISVAKRLRSEYVVAVIGSIVERSPETVNPKLETGDVEVIAREIRILNESKTPPFSVTEDATVSEDTRLRYRYLDLRRPRMQANIGLRHRLALAVREHFDTNGFWEIETPVLAKSTPEGARDYLVPSRVQPGKFYALPQSPQLFKQLLMIAGTDRYFQIVKCFRDEDLRADRQPEFTQIDVEISFATRKLVFGVIEPLMCRMLKVIGRDVELPFGCITYQDAMRRYGTDKPDLRFGMPIVDLSALFADTPFVPFREVLEARGVVRGIVVPKGARYSRREIDELMEQASQLGAAGLVWARFGEDGTVQSSAKTAGESVLRRVIETAGAERTGLVLMAGGEEASTSKMFGQLRLNIAKREALIATDEFAFTWVVDFPLFEWDETEQRYVSVHHPFTAPMDEDLSRLDEDPGAVRAKAYDLVLNGWEIGGGSIRIHNQQLQRRVFRLLRITDEEARLRFGFFLDALEYGTPPHGGIALGFDRIVAMFAGETSIREVIAFPKTATAVDLMAGAPSAVDARQLKELSIRTEA